jgi:predicted acetyltransferase
MEILVNIGKKEEKEILRNLLEKYHYEHSQYDDRDVNALGLFDYDYLDNYWTEENKFPYFIRVDDKLAGFIMINDYLEAKFETDYTVSECFIMYKYRQKGIGKFVVKYILDKHKGKWQLNFHPKNEISKNFWKKTIEEYTKGKYEIKNDPKWKYEDGTVGYTILFES